jgi:hypothetical protein
MTPEENCPIVPRHLAHRISQENWDWINETSIRLCKKQQPAYGNLLPWQVRELWLTTFFMYPSEDHFNNMIFALKQYGIIGNNLEYLELVEDLKSRVKSC